ncbi:DUF2569 domain-containing protein [Brucella intermedia]|uniref:DUF2569 family protein n=1 Tax=Brucella intermedia TaxID=94625 RepID=UPI001E5912F9|nr:DUF2569 family protein [Brucella intermedia]MCB4916941.1 DUF2569 domain-containing protein [Brucella intermedia]
MFNDFFKKEPIGIGGFLLIPIVAVISSVIFISLDIFYTIEAFPEEVIIEIYRENILPSIVFVIILQVFLVILGILSLYFMIRRDIKTTGCLIAFFIIKVITLNIAKANLNELSYDFIIDGIEKTGQSFLSRSAPLLFVPYLVLSRRVKNTFKRNQKSSI